MLITEYAIERSKAEILADMSTGKIPTGIASFDQLVEYIDTHSAPLKGNDPDYLPDTNEYGGLTTKYWWPDDAETDACIRRCTGVQDAVDAWLKERANT